MHRPVDNSLAWRLWSSIAALLLLSGCASLAPSPPQDQSNICEIFREQPSWYDYARESQEQWGTPIATQMSFIQQESSFRSHVRPDRKRYLGFIPGPRPSSARVMPRHRTRCGANTATRLAVCLRGALT